MIRVVSVFIVLACASGIAGCATLTKGTTQSVVVSTPGVTGAQCTLKSAAIGSKVVSTPATIVLDKSVESIAVTCKKECFQDGTGLIASNTETMAAGNLIAGGIIGLGVDAASGAMNKYNAENQFAMVPIAGCKPRVA
jgi:hypothetical protein